MEGKNTFTAEELEAAKQQAIQEAINKNNSDHAAWLEKLVNEKKIADQVLDAVGKVADNAESLISIYDESPEVAQKILDRYYGGKTIEEYKAKINYQEEPAVMNDKLITEKARAIVNETKIKDTKKAFIEKLGLEWDELQAFEQEFTERLEMKSFSVDKLDEVLTKSYKYATGFDENKIKEIQRAKSIASAGSLAGNDKVAESNKSRIRNEVDDLLNGRI